MSNTNHVKTRRRLANLLVVILLVVGIPTGLLIHELRHEQATDALLAAIKAGETESALAALKAGADPNARDYQKDKPASLIERIHQLCDRLLHREVKSKSDAYKTALLLCLDLPGEDNPRLVQALLDSGADPNLTGSLFAGSPTMWAAIGHHYESLHLLIQYGGSLQQRDSNGETALSWASANGNIADIPMLLDAGADINSQDNNGDTPLGVVCRYGRGHYEAVPILIQHHANPNLRDERGYTPLDWALYREDKSLYSLLRKAGAKTGDELDAMSSPHNMHSPPKSHAK